MADADSKRQRSRIISSAEFALTRHFVPCYLDLAHMTRQDAINKHTSPIARRFLHVGRDPRILVPDGTYLYIPVRQAENVLKLTSLLKK